LAFGGNPPITGATELYDGTSWTTSPATINTARHTLGRAGTQTLALAFGGATPYSNSNRRMDRSSSSNKNNNGKLIWQNI
jgi:hypothetical protein